MSVEARQQETKDGARGEAGVRTYPDANSKVFLGCWVCHEQFGKVNDILVGDGVGGSLRFSCSELFHFSSLHEYVFVDLGCSGKDAAESAV